MKKKTPVQELQALIAVLLREVSCWKDIKKNGCNDPGWPDGCNMNLIRNHVIYDKREIKQICEESGLPIPQEFYVPTPPAVDSNYFAKPKSERAQRIMSRPSWRCANQEPTGGKYDDAQMSLF